MTDDADERNVFYVALTRARKGVFITLSKTGRDGKEILPTQFIAEMKENVLSVARRCSRYEKNLRCLHPEIGIRAGRAEDTRAQGQSIFERAFRRAGAFGDRAQ
jgi:ATP-dependent exoDNAse (exonuclease V) beta subunit